MARNPETLDAFNELMADAKRKTEIGQRIGEARERRGLKQAQVVERLGMKPDKLRKYQYWEEGKHLPSVETLEDVASALAVSFDYLMTGGDDTPPAGDILTRLDRIEQALDRVLAHLEGKTVEDLEGEIEPAATKKPLPNEGTGE